MYTLSYFISALLGVGIMMGLEVMFKARKESKLIVAKQEADPRQLLAEQLSKELMELKHRTMILSEGMKIEPIVQNQFSVINSHIRNSEDLR